MKNQWINTDNPLGFAPTRLDTKASGEYSKKSGQ